MFYYLTLFSSTICAVSAWAENGSAPCIFFFSICSHFNTYFHKVCFIFWVCSRLLFLLILSFLFPFLFLLCFALTCVVTCSQLYFPNLRLHIAQFHVFLPHSRISYYLQSMCFRQVNVLVKVSSVYCLRFIIIE